MPISQINVNSVAANSLDSSNMDSTSQYYGFKNRIINGAMQLAQRATSATVTAGTAVPTGSTGYPCVDRFFVYSTGANVTAAQVAGSGAVKNRLQITGAASVTAVGVGQRIEQLNSYDLAGSTVTLSVDLANSLLTTVTWTASYANSADTFGTIGTPSKTQIATGTFTVTSTVTNYSVNISIPSAATTGIEILFTVGAQTSGTWTIGNVQLEKGSTATLFDYRPYGIEFALCERYYMQYGPYGSGTINKVGSGLVVSSTAVSYSFYSQPMRSNPSATYTAGAQNYDGSVTPTLTSVDAISQIGSSVSVQFGSSGGGLTLGRAASVRLNSSSTDYIAFSAEL